MKMKIYKYLKFEDAVKTLNNSSVILNNPLTYNDPFDCVIAPTEKDEEECCKRIINYYVFKEFSKIILNKEIKIPAYLLLVRWELKVFIRLMRKRPYYDKMTLFDWILKPALNRYIKDNKEFEKQINEGKEVFLNSIKEDIEEIRRTLLLSCFSKTYTSILMWSHYADKHEGVCVEFDVNSDDFKEVRYDKKRHQLDLKAITAIVLGHDFIGKKIDKENKFIIKSINNLLLTKSRDWRYESEVRIIHSSNEQNDNIFKMDDKYFLKMPEIKKIYVGCKIKSENLEYLKNNYQTIDIVEMLDSNTEYKIVEKQ